MMTVMVPDLLLPTEEISGLCSVVQSLHDVSAVLRLINLETMHTGT